MPTDWLDPEQPPEDEECPECGILESEHIDGRCPSEAEVRERWGK